MLSNKGTELVKMYVTVRDFNAFKKGHAFVGQSEHEGAYEIEIIVDIDRVSEVVTTTGAAQFQCPALSLR